MSAAAVVLMAYGSPDRLEDVPAYYADIRGGRPIRPELLENLVERYRRLGIEDANPLNAITEETRAALEAGARRARLHRHEALAAADRGGDRGGARDRRVDDRRPRARAALLARLDRGLPLAAGRGAGRGRCRARLRGELARRSRPRRAPRRPHTRHGRARRLHRAFASRARPRGRRPVRGAAARDVAARRRGGRRRALVVLVPVGVGDGGAVAPAGHPRPPDGAADGGRRRACSSAPSASSPTTSRSAGTSTWRRPSARPSSACGFERIEMPNADPELIRVLAGIVRRAAALPSSA